MATGFKQHCQFVDPEIVDLRGAVIPLCHASSASIGTVVIAYVYHDASPATLA